MPLAVDAYAEIAPPMLTCVQKNDGYQFELLVRVDIDEKPVKKIRIGPYHFQDQYRPSGTILGLFQNGGPENSFMMHVSSPPGWSRIRWEVDQADPMKPTYIVWEGNLDPGSVGVFRFLSLYHPGGLRAGMEIYYGDKIVHSGVMGPNYERFEKHQH